VQAPIFSLPEFPGDSVEVAEALSSVFEKGGGI